MTVAPVAMVERRFPRWVLPILWLALTAALVLALRRLPWHSALEQARHLDVKWVFLAVVAYAIPLPLWTAEWRLLAPGAARVAFSRMFEVIAVMAAVLNSVPLFAGEASGAAMLVGRVGLSRGAAVSVIAMDQLLGGVVKIVLLAVAAIVVPLPTWLRTGILLLVLGVALMLAVLIPLAHRWDRIRDRMLTRPTPLRAIVARIVSLGVHLDAVRETHRVWRVSLLAIAKKAIELLGIVAVQMAFGLQPSFPAAILVLSALAIATMMPIAPANIGVYEAMVFGAYRYLRIPTETAIGLAVVQHLCFLLPTLATGYVILTWRQLLPRRMRAS